ncbi:MAG: arginine--tRNA ligase, partial [Armatimonadota bacterium]
MPCALDRLRAEAASLLSATGLVAADAVALSEPRQAGIADLAFPVFAVAKTAGAPPPDFAARLAEACSIPAEGLVASVDAAGGFVNITAHPGRFAAAVLADVVAAG